MGKYYSLTKVLPAVKDLSTQYEELATKNQTRLGDIFSTQSCNANISLEQLQCSLFAINTRIGSDINDSEKTVYSSMEAIHNAVKRYIKDYTGDNNKFASLFCV